MHRLTLRNLTGSIVIAMAMTAPAAYPAYTQAGNRIKTVWADEVTPGNARPEYPRPIMERTEWKNLNGLWNYAIAPVGEAKPEMEGEILVPFCAESSLSGVGRNVGDGNELWYERRFSVPSDWKGRNVLLNFGAVDWKCDVWVNGVKAGTHTGGYTPFSLDITEALKPKGENTLTVRVWDPTDNGPQPRGKQVGNPELIWYTPVTGIWQTVWIEPVAPTHITGLKTTPDIDRHSLTVEVAGTAPGTVAAITVKDADGKTVASGSALGNSHVEISMPKDAQLWSPDNPYLYDLEIELYENGRCVDKVRSYAAMRKFSTGPDRDGITRLLLNNEPLFQFGPLDQGWWPDGLYTAPTHEAMVFDVDKTKELGFNMIRKHIKVEPATWYTYCDRNGIIVWQDMPSGDFNGHRGRIEPEWQQWKYFDGGEFNRSAESESCYRKEWKEIIDALYSYPCIGVWVPFNEGWGQFKTPEIAEWTMQYDPTRPCNPASGGNYYHCGDILDLHSYPGPNLYLFDTKRANVVGEYGGIGYVVKDHIWEPDRNWGYIQFNSPKEVTDEYVKYAEMLLNMVPRGISGGVYTQTTDVEIEVNGLMTYDRKIMKTDEDRIRKANRRLTESLKKAGK